MALLVSSLAPSYPIRKLYSASIRDRKSADKSLSIRRAVVAAIRYKKTILYSQSVCNVVRIREHMQCPRANLKLQEEEKSKPYSGTKAQMTTS